MDWQKVYKGEAGRAAEDLMEALFDNAEREVVVEAWERLKREMNHLDWTTGEIPL